MWFSMKLTVKIIDPENIGRIPGLVGDYLNNGYARENRKSRKEAVFVALYSSLYTAIIWGDENHIRITFVQKA